MMTMPQMPTEDALVAFAALGTQLQQSPERRFMLGIAGIGGSGKSTLAAQLVDAAQAAGIAAVLVPMDGFHLTNAELERRGVRHLKGTPETFDAQGYAAVLRAIRADAGPVLFPIYDRQLHEPVLPADEAHTVQPQHRLVITEGNYLLLQRPPWQQIADLLDETWLLDVPVELARERIIARHIRGGRTPEDARAHSERVDGPNAAIILEQGKPPGRLVTVAGSG